MSIQNGIALRLFTVLVAALLGTASAQFDWNMFPRDGPSIPAFLHPPSGRAIPVDERAVIVISQGLITGGTMRVTASPTRDAPGFKYNFGLDDYRTLRDVARCPRPSEVSAHVSEYHWGPEAERVIAGVPGDKSLVFYCTDQLTVGFDFHPDTDPRMPYLLVWIGAKGPQPYTFNRVAEGFYQGDPWAIMQLFSYMTTRNDTMYAMVGGPTSVFVASNYTAFVQAFENLPCVEGGRFSSTLDPDG